MDLGFMYLFMARFVQVLKVFHVVCSTFCNRYYVMGFDFLSIE